MKRLAVLLSGRGSNFVSIHEAIRAGKLRGCSIVCVGSNREDAAGLARAAEFGIETFVAEHRTFNSRGEHEEAVLRALDRHSPDVIVLAGYMRKLSAAFIEHYRNRIVNIHPSLLPSFPGVDAQRQALEHGVKVTGCTVHLVDESLDGGPILVQRTVPVLQTDSVESLSERILEQEHIAYAEALQQIVDGIEVNGRVVRRQPAPDVP